MRIAVTGASGFIGSRLCERLVAAGEEVIAIRRGLLPGGPAPGRLRQVAVGDLGADTEFTPALAGCDAVVHLAARAHRGEGLDAASVAAFQRVNVQATAALIAQAAGAGVARFVFMSSCKVHGECSVSEPGGRPHAFSPADPPAPAGPYGATKRAAEQHLVARCEAAGIALTILRPPLVYGPGVGGNLQRLMTAIVRGWPLPLASIRNLRSLVYLDHLIDAVFLALRAPGAAPRTYTLADCALSTPDLVRALAAALGRRAWLVPCPVPVLRAAGWLGGRSAAVSRLVDSLVLDSRAIERELGWRPAMPLAAAMAEVGRAHLAAIRR